VPPQPTAKDLGVSDISPSHTHRVSLSLQGGDEAIDVGAKRTRPDPRANVGENAKQLEHGLLLYDRHGRRDETIRLCRVLQPAAAPLDRGEMASDPPTRHNPALNIAAIHGHLKTGHRE